MAEKTKVFEEKKSGLPIWMWLLPLLLLLALGAWFLTRDRGAAPVAATTAANAQSLGFVYFDTDKATIKPESQTTLDHAADLMKQKPDMKLRVHGFTDSTGDAAHNVALSNERSDSVTQYLTAKGVDKSRLSPEGFGESNPAATNATTEGKAENRRVELFQQ